MRWRYALACCVTLGLLGLAASSTSFAEDKKEPINKEKLVGTWELLKAAGGFEAGSTFEFTKNGKLKIDIKGENARRDEATFTVEGDTLTFFSSDGQERDKKKIKKLTDTALVIEIFEFKKK
jgi:uncharacterized protein (TIGR03066 family)